MDDALRPARHLSEKVPKHHEKSGISESKPAMNKPPARSRGEYEYKVRKLKKSGILEIRRVVCYDKAIIADYDIAYSEVEDKYERNRDKNSGDSSSDFP